MSRRSRRCAALVVLVALLAQACASGESASQAPTPESTPSVSVSVAPAAPSAPAVGSCHDLDFEQATQPIDSKRAVPCTRPHTSVTIMVGQIDPLQDGHLLAVDSPAVRVQLARVCPPALPRYLGGSVTAQRLSRLDVVSFAPSLEQADAGANWFRCDVVALRSKGTLMQLPRSLKGALDSADALDRFGTCGTSAPDRRGFERISCSEPHSWRAVDVIEIDKQARYLAKDAGAAGDASCRGIAADRAGSSLKFSWSFEWPTEQQWKSGQRYGYCWVPQS
ncbi:MAG: septum formation family protein [Marmoricola sp.]